MRVSEAIRPAQRWRLHGLRISEENGWHQRHLRDEPSEREDARVKPGAVNIGAMFPMPPGPVGQGRRTALTLRESVLIGKAILVA